MAAAPEPIIIDNASVAAVAGQPLVRYDKSGDGHYDLISAMIKSVRGSDADAAIYWMARILAAGEDPAFVARRLVILASEGYRACQPQCPTTGRCWTTLSSVHWHARGTHYFGASDYLFGK